jgi:hypothetical protein
MGAWGTAIFSDDTARDIRDEFRDLIGEGLSTEQATEKLLSEYACRRLGIHVALACEGAN